MTTTTVAPRAVQPLPVEVTQTTSIEQARAVAEVQAAVTVAQQVPRNRGRAEAEMRETCGRSSTASKAFYNLPRKGATITGPTVHLMRELARIWGNIDYGVRELNRNDVEGISEIQAYAWDQENNVRSTRSFIVPHARMVKGSRQPIIDIGDIYLNNQNQGARAVRECISTVLPSWYAEEAQQICRATIENGEGEPLTQRIDKMINGFRALHITEQAITAKLGRPRSGWTAGDLADLTITYQTLRRGEITLEEAFPVPAKTIADITRLDTQEVTQ